jgi:hypothetical protein
VEQLLDALRRDGDSSNTLIGTIILILLLTFVGPDILPQLVANSLPFLDEGIPCTALRTADNRGIHQSLIGRAANDPLIIRTEIDPLPTDGVSNWTVRIIVINNTIGTVPFVFNENQLIIGDEPTSSGLGLVFAPALGMTLDLNGDGIPNARVQGQTSFPDNDIRILGPRQRCVYRLLIPASQLSGIQAGQTRVRAYYRITSDGIVQQVGQTPAVFFDQGLGVISGGYVESEPVIIPIVAFATGS